MDLRCRETPLYSKASGPKSTANKFHPARESNREPLASQHLIPRTLGYSATDKRDEKSVNKVKIMSIY